MPVNSQFMHKSSLLTLQEYIEITEDLCGYGLEEVRLTGGEPLLRSDFQQIVQGLDQLPLKKIGLTTNAVLLDRHLSALSETKCKSINISLDSLNHEGFKKITNADYLDRVITNIESAKKLDFNIKINAVLMKGVNTHEIFDFIEFSSRYQVEVRFLEIMRIGYACNHQTDQFISAVEVINSIKKKFEMKPILRPKDSTSFSYLLDNGAQIGFIASESQPFCGNCSRWRLSADGRLKACLLKEDSLSVKNKSKNERSQIYSKLLGMKPYLRPKEVLHQMNEIGG
jgi:cyclic pyranopterin phosphate synthase